MPASLISLAGDSSPSALVMAVAHALEPEVEESKGSGRQQGKREGLWLVARG